MSIKEFRESPSHRRPTAQTSRVGEYIRWTFIGFDSVSPYPDGLEYYADPHRGLFEVHQSAEQVRLTGTIGGHPQVLPVKCFWDWIGGSDTWDFTWTIKEKNTKVKIPGGDRTFTTQAGEPFLTEVLPVPSEGNAPFTYNLYSVTPGSTSPARLPSGIFFDPSTHRLHGRANIGAGVDVYSNRYVITDVDGDMDEIIVNIDVTDPDSRPEFPRSTQYLRNKVYEYANGYLDEAFNGNPELRYKQVEGNAGGTLPPGVRFDNNTRQFSGRITGTNGPNRPYYSYFRVTDEDGDTADLSVVWNVSTVVTAPFISNKSSSIGDDAGKELPIDEATGPGAPFTYSIPVRQLPPGVSFNTSTLQWSGIIRGPIHTYRITLTVEDNYQVSANRTFLWRVSGGLFRSLVDVNLDKRNTVGDDVNTPLWVADGTGIRYTLLSSNGRTIDNVIPDLVFDTSTNPPTVRGVVQGPAPAAPILFRYTARETDGDSDYLEFRWTIDPAPTSTTTPTIGPGPDGPVDPGKPPPAGKPVRTPYQSSKVRIGVPYQAHMSLPQMVQSLLSPGTGFGEPHRASKVSIGAYRSYGGEVGPNADALWPLMPADQTALHGTDSADLVITTTVYDPTGDYESLMVFRQTLPQPFNLLFIELEMDA